MFSLLKPGPTISLHQAMSTPTLLPPPHNPPSYTILHPSHVSPFPRAPPPLAWTDRTHCASFHMGVGKDGSPILSWSDLFAFYQLPDGSKWAEHGYFHDAEDLVRPAPCLTAVLHDAEDLVAVRHAPRSMSDCCAAAGSNCRGKAAVRQLQGSSCASGWTLPS